MNPLLISALAPSVRTMMAVWLALSLPRLVPDIAFASALPAPCQTVFDRVWNEAKPQVYPVEREHQFFTKEKYNELSSKLKSCKTLDELSDVLNPFLNSMNLSHTGFYTTNDSDLYFFRSLFSTRNLEEPRFRHIGVQYDRSEKNHHWSVRSTLEGYPAHQAGLRRGDRIISANDHDFSPVRSLENKERVSLHVQRGNTRFTVSVPTVMESFHFSMAKAMKNSARTIKLAGKSIFHLRLWSGTHPEILKSYLEILASNEAQSSDGLVLDLRDGFGGAWYDYLDPFFPNRDGFFIATQVDRYGNQSAWPKPSQGADLPPYSKPMIVLINEGVRSGKEALAYQFKKSRRASLVGTTTAGAFTGGKGIFSDEPVDYFLYLGVFELLLDGNKVEGVGITPDIEIPYPLDAKADEDPQLSGGLRELLKLLGTT